MPASVIFCANSLKSLPLSLSLSLPLFLFLILVIVFQFQYIELADQYVLSLKLIQPALSVSVGSAAVSAAGARIPNARWIECVGADPEG